MGVRSVSGRRRVPEPPTRMTASGGAHGDGVEQVPSVDDQRGRHDREQPAVEHRRRELGPLGDDHDRVGARRRFLGRGAELDLARQRAAGRVVDRRIERHDVCALAEQPRGEHDAGCLSHVIGIGLERQTQ